MSACWICGMPTGGKQTYYGECKRIRDSVLRVARRDEQRVGRFAKRYGDGNEWIVWARKQIAKVMASKRCDRRLISSARKRLAKYDEGMHL